MSNSESSVGGGSSYKRGEDDHTPLWKYVTRIERLGTGGGNWLWKCHYCNCPFKGSYSRVKAHLMRTSGCGIKVCSAINVEHLNEMRRMVEQAELRVKSSIAKPVPLSTSIAIGTHSSLVANRDIGGRSVLTPFMPSNLEAKKRKGVGNSAIEVFNSGARDELHAIIARMFYSAGLPFQLARNPYYVMSYTYAAKNAIPDYYPPGYNLLRTTLLQNERSNIEQMFEPIKSTWKENGVSIVSDGWSDADKRHAINFMAVTESGSMFLKAVNTEGKTIDRHYIADLLVKTIKEVGPQNVVQVITDYEPVCKEAGALVEMHYPHIFWSPCVVYALNLALKSICAAKNTEVSGITYDECSWITKISGDVLIIRNFIMNHSMKLAMFNEHVKLKMLAIAETRFASVVVMLRRFKTIKHGLQDMVISERWSLYREDDVGIAKFVKEKVVDDLWWDKIDYIISFTEPIYEMLRVANTDKPSLHLVYAMWDSMIKKVKSAIYRHEGKRDDEESTFYGVVHMILVDWRSKSNTPLHFLAHSLNPRYYSSEWLNESTNRVAPYMDKEISNERGKCLKRYFLNIEERRLVNTEFAKFMGALEAFSDHDSLRDRRYMDPKVWWVVYGSSTPNLQALALKVLGQPCSSCCERNWSTYSFMHTLKMNKMTPAQVEDLVYVHMNLRLFSRNTPQYHKGETKMWDLGGDAFDSFEGASFLEIANLSLDEPELEAVVFPDEGNGEDGEIGTDSN